jgi:hypothetical protein
MIRCIYVFIALKPLLGQYLIIPLKGTNEEVVGLGGINMGCIFMLSFTEKLLWWQMTLCCLNLIPWALPGSANSPQYIPWH